MSLPDPPRPSSSTGRLVWERPLAVDSPRVPNVESDVQALLVELIVKFSSEFVITRESDSSVGLLSVLRMESEDPWRGASVLVKMGTSPLLPGRIDTCQLFSLTLISVSPAEDSLSGMTSLASPDELGGTKGKYSCDGTDGKYPPGSSLSGDPCCTHWCCMWIGAPTAAYGFTLAPGLPQNAPGLIVTPGENGVYGVKMWGTLPV
jgi:hypothetical protein